MKSQMLNSLPLASGKPIGDIGSLSSDPPLPLLERKLLRNNHRSLLAGSCGFVAAQVLKRPVWLPDRHCLGSFFFR